MKNLHTLSPTKIDRSYFFAPLLFKPYGISLIKVNEIRVIFDVVSIGHFDGLTVFKVTKTQRKKIFLRRNSFDVVALPVLKNCYALIKKKCLEGLIFKQC